MKKPRSIATTPRSPERARGFLRALSQLGGLDRDSEDKHSGKPAHCLFIAPRSHGDTVNTFWRATKYGYGGRPQRIAPLSISQFVSALNILFAMKSENTFLRHEDIMIPYDEIAALPQKSQKSDEWLNQIPGLIESWGEKLASRKTT